MAPHDPNQNRIDVSLNIMSEATLTAVNQLTDQLSTLREFLAGQQMAGNPAAQAQSAGGSWSQAGAQVSYSGGYTLGRVPPNRPTGPVAGGPPVSPDERAQASKERAKELREEYEAYIASVKGGGVPTTIGADAESMMGQHLGSVRRFNLAVAEARNPGVPKVKGAGGAMDRFFELYQGSHRDPDEDDTYNRVSQQGPGGGAMSPGIVSTADGPTGKGSPDPAAPGWSQTLERDGITSTSNAAMTVPRLGEFTTQDKLRMAAKYMGQAAQRSQEAGKEKTFGVSTNAVGRTAATASYLADNAALLTSLHHGYQRVKGYAAEQTAAGTELGFSADTGVSAEFAGVGARLNLPGMSEASREGLHEELTQRRIAAAAGVSTAQAKEIRATVRGMGYGGDQAANLSYNLFKPLAKRGISAETWAPVVDQGFRQGTMTVNELKDAVIGLAESAKNANLTMDEARDATIAYTEAMQGMGGGLKNATRGAETFLAAGLDPRIAAEGMKSPLTQGIATMKYGVPADMQGVLGPAMQGEAMDESARIAMSAGSAYLNSPDIKIRAKGGQVIETVTGEDKRLAFASNMSGIPRTVLERIQRNPNFLQDGLKTASMITAMGDQITDKKKPKPKKGGARTNFEGALDRSLDTLGKVNPALKTVGNAAGWLLDKSGIGGDGDGLTDEQRDSFKGNDPTNKTIQYGELEEQLRTMDPGKDWQDKVSKITKKDGTIDLKKAKDLVKEATDPTKEPDYLVGLTKQAKGLLTIMPNKNRKDAKDNANKGGAAVNNAYGGASTGNAPTGAATQGVPGG